MRLGTQYSPGGSKYPFDEASKFASNVPSSAMSDEEFGAKIPCDLFRDVTIDFEDNINLHVVGFGGGKLDIEAVWREKNAAGIYEIYSMLVSIWPNNFNMHGRALYVSKRFILQIELHDHDLFSQFVSSEPVVFDVPVEFDSRCYRLSEKRLHSFVVPGKGTVAGNVVFKPGYNTSIEAGDFDLEGDNSLSIDFSPGSGEGFLPCSGTSPEPEGVVGLMPNSDGSIRISTDGCYSIVPISTSTLKIQGHCSACCSCEGDYFPVAMAAVKLIDRIMTAYEKLNEIKDRYHQILDEYISTLNDDVDISFICFAKKYTAPYVDPKHPEKQDPSKDRFHVDLDISLENALSKKVVVTKLTASVGSVTINYFGGRFDAGDACFERHRMLQIGSSRTTRGLSPAGHLLETGVKLRVVSTIEGLNSSTGRSVYNSGSAVFFVEYRIYDKLGKYVTYSKTLNISSNT